MGKKERKIFPLLLPLSVTWRNVRKIVLLLSNDSPSDRKGGSKGHRKERDTEEMEQKGAIS